MSKIDERTTVGAMERRAGPGETIEGLSAFLEAGVIVADAAGRFPLLASCRAIIAYWHSVIAAAGRA